jgi:GTP-binding protein HflX
VTNKAILVGVDYQNHTAEWTIEDSLNELEELAKTVSLQVIEKTVQTRDIPHYKYYIGPGKLESIKNVCQEMSVSIVIFDDELSPSQQKNLEKFLNVKVIDRTGLILDIFAMRAKTHEAQLQVELAQLEYLLPRLTRLWTHLSRLGGGIGTRGPGEKQLEVDKRRIYSRIKLLKDEIEKVKKQRDLHRKKRLKVPVLSAAIVGYTNAGKSTLMKLLTQADVLIENKLFATLDPTTRKFSLPIQGNMLITDTVGFIKKLPHQLVTSFRSTLEEVAYADIILHVIDVSHPNFLSFYETAKEILEDLKVTNKPQILVLNKIDKIENLEIIKEKIAKIENLNFVFISALQKANIEELLNKIDAEIKRFNKVILYRIPYDKMEIVNMLYEKGTVLSVDYKDYIEIEVDINTILGEKIMGLLGKEKIEI